MLLAIPWRIFATYRSSRSYILLTYTQASLEKIPTGTWVSPQSYPEYLLKYRLQIGEGNGTPLQYSSLENPIDRGAWQATVYGVPKSRTQLSDYHLHFHFSLSCTGEGNGNPLQCSCLEIPRDRGACWAAIYGFAQSRTRLTRLKQQQQASDTYPLFILLSLYTYTYK